LHRSVTAIADKLGLEFALFHRKRDGKTQDAPEKMELLVGDVRDKVSSLSPTVTRHPRPLSFLIEPCLGGNFGGRHD
jgi:hypothetical protein